MCSEPITHEGQTFACRHCNECIATRKNDWVARCMAEKATSTEVIAIELTYRNNPDGTKPDGAKAFRYRDVQLFLKGLRDAYYRQYGAAGEIRYIVAGERGSKRNRVHWHMILFADRPMSRLGKWLDFIFKPIHRMRLRKMIHWTLWPHGHVFCREPHEGGMQYVLKYALKDQFSVEKSKGTMRHAKAENTAASMFRMSKTPPIGQRYLERKCDEWERRGVVPVKLELSLPDYNGFWWPKKQQREYLLHRLHAINQKVRAKTGRNAPQWAALLSTLSEVKNEKDWENLVYGPLQNEYQGKEEEERHWQTVQRKSWDDKLSVGRPGPTQVARQKLGGPECPAIATDNIVCRECWDRLGRKQKTEVRKHYEKKYAEYLAGPKSESDFAGWYHTTRQGNPWCEAADL